MATAKTATDDELDQLLKSLNAHVALGLELRFGGA